MRRYVFLALGGLGLIEALVPGIVVRGFTRVAYRNAEDAESRAWLRTAVRAEGGLLVAVAIAGLFRASGSAEATAQGPDRAGDVDGGSGVDDAVN